MKIRHTPIRTCVACRQTDAKRGLLRVVRLTDGTVRHDPTGKQSGRGAYVCAAPGCIALARKGRKFERSLKVSGISEELFAELGAQVPPPDVQTEGDQGSPNPAENARAAEPAPEKIETRE